MGFMSAILIFFKRNLQSQLATLLVVTLSTMKVIRTTGSLTQISGTTGLRLDMNTMDRMRIQQSMITYLRLSWPLIWTQWLEAELTTNLLWTQPINYKAMLYRYSVRRHQASVDMILSTKSLPPPSARVAWHTGWRNECDSIKKSSSYCQAVPRLRDAPEKTMSGRARHGCDGGTSLVVECGTNMCGTNICFCEWELIQPSFPYNAVMDLSWWCKICDRGGKGRRREGEED